MLLAGDVGATKTLMGLFTPDGDTRVPVCERAYPTRAHAGLDAIIDAFLAEAGCPASRVEAASFGVAGPIVSQAAQLTNVAWRIDARDLAARCALASVVLLNDLEAMAYSVEILRPEDLVVLQPGERDPEGNAALIAAGTGLGEALLHRVGGRLVPSPTEGGHADFAPRTPREVALLVALIERFGRADYERVLSGPGLQEVHRFVHTAGCAAVDADADPETAPARITRAGIEGTCPDCVETLDLFVSVYGAEAGNLALRSMASSGVFIGGGIAPRILPALRSGLFMAAFGSKPPMESFLARVPVAVILETRAGLLGAAVHAARRARARA